MENTKEISDWKRGISEIFIGLNGSNEYQQKVIRACKEFDGAE